MLIKRLRGLTYAVLLLKKNFSESLEVKLKSLYLCSPVRKKGSFFVDTFALAKRVLEGESEKKLLKKNFRKHLVVTFKLLTFAPALENKAKIKEAFFDRIT